MSEQKDRIRIIHHDGRIEFIKSNWFQSFFFRLTHYSPRYDDGTVGLRKITLREIWRLAKSRKIVTLMAKEWRTDVKKWESTYLLFGFIPIWEYSVRGNRSIFCPFKWPGAKYPQKMPQVNWRISEKQFQEEYQGNKYLLPVNMEVQVVDRPRYRLMAGKGILGRDWLCYQLPSMDFTGFTKNLNDNIIQE